MKDKMLALIAFALIACNGDQRIALNVPESVNKEAFSLKASISRNFPDNDPLVQKGINFLFQNISYRSTADRRRTDAYLKAINDNWVNEPALMNELKRLRVNSPAETDTVYDVSVIDSGYLGRNIKNAFAVYRRSAWKNQVTFKTFCDFVLPYRVNNEPYFDDWRTYFTELYFQDHDSLIYDMRMEEAAAWIQSWLYLRKKEFKIIPGDNFPDLPPTVLDKLTLGTCNELTAVGAAAMRSFGIPTTIDFTPCYLNVSGSHQWNSILVNPSLSIPFDVTTNKLYRFKQPKDQLAKVYRRSFRYIRESHFNARGRVSYLPKWLNDPYLEDVTPEYVKTSAIKIKIRNNVPPNAKYCYLSVFKPDGWAIVGWGRISGGFACFRDVGRGGVYLATVVEDARSWPINSPVLVDESSQVHYLIPDSSALQTVRLIRKYPMINMKMKWLLRMVGGRFQGANSPDFQDAVDLYRIKENPGEHFNEVVIDNKDSFRYVRYFAPKSSFGNVAEVEFYEHDSDTGKLSGTIIGTEGSIDPFTKKEAALDGKVLTMFNAAVPDSCWVGLDLGGGKKVGKIRFLARNDMNSIQKGKSYELLYWNKEWVSLGSKVADTTSLNYNNVPAKSLLWLRCSEGAEERIFTYENGVQVWQ